MADWHRRNKVARNATARKRHAENTDKESARSKKYYQANRAARLKKCSEWKKRNPDKVEGYWKKHSKNRPARAAYSRKCTYGITLARTRRLLEKQAYKCAICFVLFEGAKFCVDHNHDTGAVRGLLCRRCNTGIGMMYDSLKIVLNASFYLQEHSKLKARGGK